VVVVGAGPSGNYSFGTLTVPFMGTVTYKSATTEDGTTYTVSCIRGECTVSREKKWPFTSLIHGVAVTRTARGQCRHLNYIGTLYEERGTFAKAPSRLIEGATGNYTAYVCEVNGVMLYADLTATVSTRGETAHLAMKIEAAKAGPYRPDMYRLILSEIKANK
jgi:hypothetical protein